MDENPTIREHKVVDAVQWQNGSLRSFRRGFDPNPHATPALIFRQTLLDAVTARDSGRIRL